MLCRCWSRWVLSVICIAVVPAFVGFAETADPTSESTSDREREFQELAREVSALERQGMLLRKLVRLVTPSVVHIDAERPTDESPSYRQGTEEAGSGVIISVEGKPYVVTNRHVVDEAPLSHIKIKLDDGRTLRPTSKWEDNETDIAVLAIAGKNLVPARVVDTEAVDIGDFVVAVGSPFGLSHSVTFGIISAMGRRDLELGDKRIRYQDFLQTDAAINPGNSGGPLLNLRGEVIGINTAIASSSGGSEGIGFTIPSHMVMAVARQFVLHGRVQRAYLGVELEDDFTPEMAMRLGVARPQGALVKAIRPNTPAANSGLQASDIIVNFDGHRVEDDEHLIKMVGFTDVRKEVEVLVYRKGKSLALRVQLDDRESVANP